MLGEGATHGSPVSLELHRALPPGEGHDAQLAVDALLRGEQPRQLADRHPVPYGERIASDERGEGGVEHRALDREAADRVRPVEDHDRDARLARGLHHVRDRVHEGVVAAAHVLQVDDDRVEPGEVRRGRS